MNILITGANGFIGKHIYDGLRKNASWWTKAQIDNVLGVDLRGDENIMNLDLRNKEKTAVIIEEFSPDVVYHFAANAAENKSQFSPIEITENNMMIFLNTLVPAINSGMRRFIFPSSVAVYGEREAPLRESDTVIPKDIYGVNKKAIEDMLRILSKVHDFEFVIPRLHNVFGPGQAMSDPYRNVVTIFMNQLLKGEPYYIYGDGNMTRNFSYIDDVLDALIQLKDSEPGITINIGSSTARTINELSDAVQKASDKEIEPIYLEDRPQEAHSPIPEHSICKETFGYKDTNFEEAIKKTWEYCKNKGQQEAKLTEVEIKSDKLPENWKK